MKGNQSRSDPVLDVFEAAALVSLCLYRSIGSGNDGIPPSFPSEFAELDGFAPTNSNIPSPSARFWFPRAKSRASDAVCWFVASRCTRNWPEVKSALSVSEGRRTLNEITGVGDRVTVLKEETVMPRKPDAEVGSESEVDREGSVEVTMATG